MLSSSTMPALSPARSCAVLAAAALGLGFAADASARQTEAGCVEPNGFGDPVVLDRRSHTIRACREIERSLEGEQVPSGRRFHLLPGERPTTAVRDGDRLLWVSRLGRTRRVRWGSIHGSDDAVPGVIVGEPIFRLQAMANFGVLALTRRGRRMTVRFLAADGTNHRLGRYRWEGGCDPEEPSEGFTNEFGESATAYRWTPRVAVIAHHGCTLSDETAAGLGSEAAQRMLAIPGASLGELCHPATPRLSRASNRLHVVYDRFDNLTVCTASGQVLHAAHFTDDPYYDDHLTLRRVAVVGDAVLVRSTFRDDGYGDTPPRTYPRFSVGTLGRRGDGTPRLVVRETPRAMVGLNVAIWMIRREVGQRAVDDLWASDARGAWVVARATPDRYLADVQLRGTRLSWRTTTRPGDPGAYHEVTLRPLSAGAVTDDPRGFLTRRHRDGSISRLAAPW